MDRAEKVRKREQKRKLKQLRDHQYLVTTRHRSSFPEILYENADCCPPLSKETKEIVESLVGANQMPKKLRKDLEDVKLHGLKGDTQKGASLSIALGELIYDRIKISFHKYERMAFDLEVNVGGRKRNAITFSFHSLETVRPRLFCPPMRYRVEIIGENRIVAYRAHVLERLGERTVAKPDSYICRGQAFAIPYRCQYFDICSLPNGKPAARIWNWCDPTTFLGKFHRELLPSRVATIQRRHSLFYELDGEVCYYLVGYCPVRFFPDLPEYVIFDSLWIPGMDHTPEFATMTKKSKLDTVARCNLSKRASGLTYARLAESKDFDLIRQFHEITPQVRPIAERVFDY